MNPLLISTMLLAVVAMPVTAADQRDEEISDLRSMVDTLRREVELLRAEGSDQWLTEQRTEQIRSIVQDVLADADTRASLQGDGATSGYNGGFFMQSGDGNWKLKINGQIQSRFMYNHASEQAHDYGFEVRRLKLRFSGHIVDPSWDYRITIINQRDSQGNNGNSNTMYVEDAWLSKTFDDGLYFKVGQFKAPFLREELVSSSAQLAVERSMISNQFTYGWTQGVELGSKGDDLWWRAMCLDGPNSANTQSQGLTNDAASITARVDWRLAGDWKEWKTFTGYGPKSDSYAFVGAAFQWFNRSNRAANPLEYGGYEGNQSIGLTVDGSVGGEGWTAYGAFVWADNAGSAGVAGPDSNHAWGAVVQGGYMVAEDFQIFARYELGDIDGYNQGNATYANTPNPWAPLSNNGRRTGHDSTVTVGFNNWLAGKNVKWTTDLGYAFSTLNNGGNEAPSADYTSSGSGWRADTAAESGQWLLRSQLQLLF
ncbi:MAG: porin [Phycisphaerales bacterium]|jgi:hypothetical protein|nr:porin [Phycisphaerales bacterium]